MWEHVRVLGASEVVSTVGTHLGHMLPDERGPRYCINLCSIAGLPLDAAAEGDACGRLVPSSTLTLTLTLTPGLTLTLSPTLTLTRRRAAWPLLHELAAVGRWRGQMHYASGEQGMTPTPLLLAGEMRRLTLTLTPTLTPYPNHPQP